VLEKLIYGVIGFFIGGIVGGGVMGFVVTDELKGRIDNLESQNRSLREELGALKKQEKAEVITITNSEIEAEVQKRVEEETQKRYEELRKHYISEDDDDYHSWNSMINPPPIRMIDEQTFNEDRNYRDTDSLVYYQQDGTLVDSQKDIVSNPSEIIGDEAMDIIDDTLNDYIYVLDEQADMVYEISIEHSLSYTRDVLGVAD